MDVAMPPVPEADDEAKDDPLPLPFQGEWLKDCCAGFVLAVLLASLGLLMTDWI